MAKAYYTSSTPMRHILKDNYRKTDLLYLLGIKIAYDDISSVEEVCCTNRIDTDLFLHICNIYTFDDYLPEENTAVGFPVDPAIDYINTAHGFFTGQNIVGIHQYFEGIQPLLAEGNNDGVKTLYDTFMAAVAEHVACVYDIFAQYRKSPGSIKKEQADYIIGQEMKINVTLDSLINRLNEIPATEQYKVHVDQLRYYLIFLRSDFDRHNLIKNTTLEKISS